MSKLWLPAYGDADWAPSNGYPRQYSRALLEQLSWGAAGAPAIEWPVYAGRDTTKSGIGDFRGFKGILRMLHMMGYRIVWFPPFYPSDGDGGYAITDYEGIDPRYGTMDDFKALLDYAHQLGMKVLVDLVVGHTSINHSWFLASCSNPDGPYGDFYLWDPEGKKGVFYIDEHGVRHEVRNILVNDPDPRKVIASDGVVTPARNWWWNTIREEYFWCRFFKIQAALNYRNPTVRDRMMGVMRFWLELGVDGFRVDALPFTWMEDGTPSEDQPEVHGIVEEWNEELRPEFPDMILLCESDLQVERMETYIAPGQCDAGFNFRARIDMMLGLARQDATSIEALLRKQPPLPPSLTRYLHVENHDDARVQPWDPEEERLFMREFYGNHDRGEKYLDDAVVGGIWPLLDWDASLIELLEAIRRIIPGVAMDYYRQIFGMGHHPDLALGYGKDAEGRDGGRTPPHWDDSPNAGFSLAHPRKLYLPVVEKGRGDYRIVNLKAQRSLPRSPFNVRSRNNHLLLREPLLAFGVADVLPTSSKEQLAVARWWEGLPRIVVGIHNLNKARASQVKTRLPNTDHFRQFRGAAAVDLASGVHITDLHGKDGLQLTVPLPPQGHWTLGFVSNK